MKQQYKTYLKYALIAALFALGIYLTVLVVQRSRKENACIPEKGWEKLCPGDWGCCSVKGKAGEAVEDAYKLAMKWKGYADGLKDDTAVWQFYKEFDHYTGRKYGDQLKTEVKKYNKKLENARHTLFY